MKTRTHKQDSLLIVYDAELIAQPDTRLFDPDYWQQKSAVTGKARGRGLALFLETPFGAAVLRKYLRGGWAAKFSRDRYLFTGFSRSRPLREFNMLAEHSQAGLPVAEPIAAMCRRSGIHYTGWLMTRRIMHSTPLADVIDLWTNEPLAWRRVGSCIRLFHNHGLVHADLNVRNILVDSDDVIHLVDFDRAVMREGATAAFSANLQRLRRSLVKCWPGTPDGHLEACWEHLMSGYRGS